ncbi:MAG: type VI secretion system tip protein VgrG [Gammaproteobacteria bacterium]|nr:type VI secretion system tip protein VgrG [Gammaproteobacteria bacterium]
MNLTQSNRPIAISTPLGEDVLLFQSMTAKETLGHLFEFSLDLLSEDENISIPDILGQNVTIRLELPDGENRYFNGWVSRFRQVGSEGRLALYEATVHPWLWFLTRTSDCRIFQNVTVPDIIKEVFRKHNFTNFDERLNDTYRTWEYCVQYRETDFNFVSRLMEQEGIYYYFSHESDKHTLILSDSYSSHEPIPGYENIPFYPQNEVAGRELEHISEWVVTQQIQPGTYTLDEYDFKRPRAELLATLANPQAHEHAEYEVYDYPGEYVEAGDGEQYVRTRIEELNAQHEQMQGQSNARGLTAGGLFELIEFPRPDQNREYLVTSATHYLTQSGYESDSPQEGPVYSCNFTSIDAQQPYRSPRTSAKPIVQGPQTAIITGPAGEEIWTDEHGRVKLQFHWDRYGENDENSSMWIRVSQVHAGKGFGGIDIPRIGEEVIVEFLEGDPDRPIVTGRVYNGDNKPPSGLPAAGMVSGLKSNSTPGGGGDNTMMLDDTKGKEKITIHAQYDMGTTVDHDQTNTVKNDFTETIKNNASITISEGTYKHDVKANTATYHVQGALTENYDDIQSTTANKAITIESGTAHVHIDASTVIKLHVGASTIKMDSGGNITIDGVNININAASTVTIKGKIVHSEATAEHQTKGAVVSSEGSATNTVKGGTVLLNP